MESQTLSLQVFEGLKLKSKRGLSRCGFRLAGWYLKEEVYRSCGSSTGAGAQDGTVSHGLYTVEVHGPRSAGMFRLYILKKHSF